MIIQDGRRWYRYLLTMPIVKYGTGLLIFFTKGRCLYFFLSRPEAPNVTSMRIVTRTEGKGNL